MPARRGSGGLPVGLIRWATRGVLAIVAIIAFLIFGFLPYWLGGRATHNAYHFPDTENAGLTPASFQLPFDEIAFQAKDGVPLKGWWVGAPEAHGTVVLVHGLNRSRIEMVKKVPFLHRMGWNAVLFDLRHHGESGGGVSGFGYFEKQDVAAATAFARTRSTAPVVLWGVSLGAASAMLAAAEDPTVAGVVCDSSYRSLRDTIAHHLVLFRSFRWYFNVVPSWPVASEVTFWIGRRGGFDPDAVDIRTAASHLGGRPALFVCNSGDKRMPSDIAFELQKLTGPQAKVLVVPGNSHGGAYRDGTAAYETAVGAVLEVAVAEPSPRAASR
jgi:pimeloyl-ACP methyl ester carboxylesterase